MVLYDKNGNFVGISKEELSFLGFEDFEEFKSECKDFADRFVSKPGYIFKFKNFSWIDYTLHSGAPKKSVVVKLKNGQEVETGLKISQINLVNSINEHNMYYGVELSQASLQTVSSVPQHTPVAQNFVQNEEEMPPIQPLYNDFEEDFISEPKEDFADVKLDFQDDFSEIQPKYEEESTQEIKLKINDDLYDEPFIAKTEDETIETSFESDSKLHVNFDEDSSYEDAEEDLEENFASEISLKTYEEFKEPEVSKPSFEEDFKNNQDSKEDIHFDFSECAEETGLDLSEIALILEEYLSLIEETLPVLKEAIETQNDQEIFKAILPLKGIAQTLQINTVTDILEGILARGNEEEKKDAFAKLEDFTKALQNELI